MRWLFTGPCLFPWPPTRPTRSPSASRRPVSFLNEACDDRRTENSNPPSPRPQLPRLLSCHCAQHRSPPTPRTVVDYVFALPPPPPASAQAPVPSIAAAERVKEHWDGSLTWGGPVLSTVAVSQQAKHRTTLGPGNSNSLKIEHRYSNKCLVNVHSRTRLTVAQEVGPIRRSTDE